MTFTLLLSIVWWFGKQSTNKLSLANGNILISLRQRTLGDNREPRNKSPFDVFLPDSFYIHDDKNGSSDWKHLIALDTKPGETHLVVAEQPSIILLPSVD